MRAQKILLLIGLALFCVLLVVYFMAVKGEQATTPLKASPADQKSEGVNK